MALKRIGMITVEGEQITLSRTTYPDGTTIAVVAEGADGAPYGKLSVFVRGLALEPDCFVVKDYSENKSLAAAAATSGWFADTGRRVRLSDWVEAPIWRIRHHGN